MQRLKPSHLFPLSLKQIRLFCLELEDGIEKKVYHHQNADDGFLDALRQPFTKTFRENETGMHLDIPVVANYSTEPMPHKTFSLSPEPLKPCAPLLSPIPKRAYLRKDGEFQSTAPNHKLSSFIFRITNNSNPTIGEKYLPTAETINYEGEVMAVWDYSKDSM